METRTIIQGKIYGLFMNPISGRHEDSVPVAASSEYQRLVDWYNSQRCEMWRDDWMNKQFKKGSILEDYNPTKRNNNKPAASSEEHDLLEINSILKDQNTILKEENKRLKDKLRKLQLLSIIMNGEIKDE